MNQKGEGGLLAELTKMVLESALKGETAERLGCDRCGLATGGEAPNPRYGHLHTTVTTEGGRRNSAGSQHRKAGKGQLAGKRQRGPCGTDEIALPLMAKELTHGEISAHLREAYGAEILKQTTTSTITNSVLAGAVVWQKCPLGVVYPMAFIDRVHMRVRGIQVVYRASCSTQAVTADVTCGDPGLWDGDGGKGAENWLLVVTEAGSRGVRDALRVACYGLIGLPAVMNLAWPVTTVQTCVLRLLRASFRFTSRSAKSSGRRTQPIRSMPVFVRRSGWVGTHRLCRPSSSKADCRSWVQT